MPAQPDVFNQLLRTVEAIGNERTFELLKDAEFQEVVIDNEDAKFVIENVGDAFDIPISEIIYGYGRKNERKYAIGFCAFYLHYGYGYNMEKDIQYFLKKDLTLCHKYSKLITKLNPKHVHDRKYIEIKDRLDDILKKEQPETKSK